MKLSLFDAMVAPILLYGSEVWGIYNCKEIDKLHIRFCKYILGVRKQTPNAAVYGELGRFPLSLVARERCIKFWLKIMNNVHSPMYTMYIEQCNYLNGSCWARRISSFIDHLGFSNVREYFNPEFNYFPFYKRRIRDQYLQIWNEDIRKNSKLDYFKNFKTQFGYEEYLDKINNDSLRKYFTRLRLCSHNLEIEFGRFSRINREDRLCKLCNLNSIESEYHFLMCCPKYYSIRKKYFKNISWPTIQKFNSFMFTNNKSILCSMCKFIKEAFSSRENTLQM